MSEENTLAIAGDQVAQVPADAVEDDGAQHDGDTAVSKRESRGYKSQRDKAREEAAYWRGVAETAAKAKPEPVNEARKPEGRPRADQFTDQQEYEDALVDYRLEQRLEQRQAKDKADAESRKAEEQKSTFAQRVKALESEHEGAWDEVVNAPITTNDYMVDYVQTDPDGVRVAYYLAQHPKEANAIGEMSKAKTYSALNNIADKLAKPLDSDDGDEKQPVPKPVSRAPAPAPTVSANAPLRKKPEQMSIEEIRAHLRKSRQAG